MSTIQAIVVDPAAPARLALRSAEAPMAGTTEALVRVKAISLNRGEVRRAQGADAGTRIGWDLSGVVEEQAADGSGPRKGARVVGMLPTGAWAELVAVPTNILAEIPDSVSFEQAATLPVAGLTALRALEKGGLLLGKKVLITGASGGVGILACELANVAGAHVVGVSRPERADAVKAAGAHQVVHQADLSDAGQYGPYNLILESVGGQSLANALTMLAQGGMCVNFGVSSSPEVTFSANRFFSTGGATLYGFIVFYELARRPGASDLHTLAQMVADGKLHPQIDVVAPWTEIGSMAQKLLGRQITGKAVLTVG